MDRCKYYDDRRCDDPRKEKCIEGGYLAFHIRPDCYLRMEKLDEELRPRTFPVVGLDSFPIDTTVFVE